MIERVQTPGEVKNITLRCLSDDESWDSDCTSEHSLVEMDELDNECYSGHSAEQYGLMIARALASRESSPIEGLEKEIEKKRDFVRKKFKVLRYQVHATRESLEDIEFSKSGVQSTTLRIKLRREKDRLPMQRSYC